MGLDMYAYCTEAEIPDVDFDLPEDSCEIAIWRKHPNLHGWMEQLYREKGGIETCFNCVTVKLERADIDALEKAVRMNLLPFTTGFFFGESMPEDKDDDLAFIAEARTRLDDGDQIFYTSSW